METKNKGAYVGHCYRTFCVIFFNKKNLKRDAFILSSFVFILLMFWAIEIMDKYGTRATPAVAISQSQQILGEEDIAPSEAEAVELEKDVVAKAVANVDVSSWTPYQNTWYGFSLKYPKSWADPVAKRPIAGSPWEQRIEFRNKDVEEDNPFEGFDLVIYNVAKVKEIAATEEFPKLKTAEFATEENCQNIEGHLLETGNYPAEEIYIPVNDACYNAALFFSNTRDSYIYNITPKLKEGWGLAGDPALEIANHEPEFFAVASTMALTDIVRPKPAPPKPKITAPKPASYKVVGGKMVCEKSNDKPSKSNKNKGKHLDMECCLDPDEYPNPWCYYDPAKYGKYLK